MAIGCWEGESKRYRIYNIAEGLAAIGYSVLTMPYSEVAKIVQHELRASALVLFRAPYEPIVGIDEVLSYAKVQGIKVIFDVDDLVFKPDIVDQVDGFRLLNNDQKTQYLDDVQKYRQLLLKADLVTVPTEYLRRQVATLGKPCAVIPNSINYTQLSIAKDLAQKSREEQPFIRIGYFSGSHTHNKDFQQCEQALLDIMTAYPNTVLRIVGYLDLNPYWDQFRDRIERIAFQPYPVMMHLLGEIDINIAPLEIDNPFCQSKSELKFFEAALLGIPTIASATDAYIAAIEQGVNGFYARNRDDWFSALEKLMNSAALRREMGTRAKSSALERFGIDTVARIAAMTFGLKPTQATRLPQSTATEPVPLSRRLRIAWIIPGLIIGGGGHRNILRAAYFLQQFGHQITLYFIGTEQDPTDLKQLINKHFYPIDCPVFLFNGTIQPADVVFATHWSTVSAALQTRNLVQEVMYFVQDFEPAFAPLGTEYVLAENTYRQGLYHITSGPWCEVILRRDFQADADHFQFPIDRSIYYPRPRNYERRNLIYFAKPEMPRRCFELGLIALRELHKLCPDVEIILFGSPQAGKQHYNFPVTLRDMVPTLDDLAVLYSNGDIGLVFSTTNPSLVPYEMMACGLPVVDLRRTNNEINYGNRFDIALLANPLPEKMAIEIAALLANPYECKARRKAGLEFINTFPSEEEMARRIESLILKRFYRKTQG
jgi:glycosyltransferase involved in cell wall biosynthesis